MSCGVVPVAVAIVFRLSELVTVWVARYAAPLWNCIARIAWRCWTLPTDSHPLSHWFRIARCRLVAIVHTPIPYKGTLKLIANLLRVLLRLQVEDVYFPLRKHLIFSHISIAIAARHRTIMPATMNER